MCKWEWPFVVIEIKTNKNPLRTETRLFLTHFFVCFFIKKRKHCKSNLCLRHYMDVTDTCKMICTHGKLRKQVTLSMKT